MSKKYLSLEEAANLLGVKTEELVRMRERQEIRGFADRGNWKFKVDDVETLARSRQADSDPEVPIIRDEPSPPSAESGTLFGEDILDEDTQEDEQPTMISSTNPLDADSSLFADEDDFLDPLADSDSDVRLVGASDPELDLDLEFDSDSDVQLIGEDSVGDLDDPSGTMPEMKLDADADSDSDVQLVGPDSDSDISIEDSAAEMLIDSDSDVQLINPDDDDDISLEDSLDELEVKTEAEADLILDDSDVAIEDSAADIDLMNSDSDIKLLAEDDDVSLEDSLSEIGEGSDSDINLAPPSAAGLDDGLSEIDALGSDSDVQLVGPDAGGLEDSMSELDLMGSDSDIKLEGDSGADILIGDDDDDIESDVQLMDSGTMPEMSLAAESEIEDVLAPEESGILPNESGVLPSESAILGADSGSISTSDSDSDVQLLGDDEDVMLIDDEDDAVSIDLNSDSDVQSSVLADESGISLAGDSSLMLGGESGISLEGPSDSGISLDADSDEGITLALDDDSGISLDAGDSGISLDAGDSGISLEAIADSGISLEGDSFSGTMPMMDAIGDDDDVAETQFEIPSIDADEDSSYDLDLADDGSEDDTGVVDLMASGEGDTLDDAVFDLDEDEESYESETFEDDLELDDDVFDDEDELDVFDADEDVFDDASGEQEFAAPLAGGRMAVEQEWGMGTFIGLILASACMLLCGAVMLDLVKNTATASTPNPISGMVLDILGGLYKG